MKKTRKIGPITFVSFQPVEFEFKEHPQAKNNRELMPMEIIGKKRLAARVFCLGLFAKWFIRIEMGSQKAYRQADGIFHP